MNLLLIKTLLIKKGRDEGFTLPIVIAIGLVMVLLSTVSIMQAGEENLNAISQSQSSDALAAAEIGVARYRDLLLNNRVLAVNNLARWTNNTAGQPILNNETCEFISTTTDTTSNNMGWADTTGSDAWKNIEISENDVGRDLNADGDTSDTIVSGSYRLVSYDYNRGGATPNGFSQVADDGDENNNSVYDAGENVFDSVLNNHNDTNNDGRSDARGILVVQGRDNSGSMAQLQVTMPIGINTEEMSNLNPALWIATANPPNTPNNVNVNGGNIAIKRAGISGNISGCNTTLPTITFTDPITSVTTNQNVVGDARNLPRIFDVSTVASIRDLDGGTITGNTLPTPNPNPSGFNLNFYNATDRKIILGTPLDSVDANFDGSIDPTPTSTLAQNAGNDGNLNTEDDLYVYRFDEDVTLSAGQRIEGDGNRRVILYIDGNLTITTDAAQDETQLVNSQHDSTGINEIAKFFEIHVTGNVNITGDGDVKIAGLLRTNGTVTIASNVRNVTVLGAIWANDFDDQGAASIDITPDDVEFFTIVPNRTAAPITFRPSDWETQEVN